MRRRNLVREVRNLLPHYTPPPPRVSTALQRARLVEAICRVCEADATIQAGTDGARAAAIRLIWSDQAAGAKRHWLFGKPTIADLRVLDRRVADLIGVQVEEVVDATTEHRPATAA